MIVSAIAILFLAAGIRAADPCADSAVIFCNGFEGTATEVNVAWQSPYPGYNLSPDPGPFDVADNQVLKLDFGKTTQVQKGLSKGYDKLYARWYQKWGAGYDWGLADHHGLRLCTGAGCQASGYTPNGCTDVVKALLESGGSGSSGEFHWYAYHPGKATTWGNVFNTGTSLTSNKWYCVETLMDLGTPTPSWDNADGVLDIWVDDVHYGPNDCSSWPDRCGGIWFRTCAALQLRSVWLETFQRDGKSQPGIGLYFDDFVLSTEPIGCGDRVVPGPGLSEKPVPRQPLSLAGSILTKATGSGIMIHCAMKNPCQKAELGLYGLAGNLVRTLDLSALPMQGYTHAVAWDGKSSDGREMPYGIYLARLKSEGLEARAAFLLAR